MLNDVTMRDWQYRTPQWLQGKTFEASTPIGPVLVTPDELPGGTAPALTLTASVNGEIVQKAATDDLVFTPASLVQYVSTILTLRPGDIIATGTPGGVGHARRPARYLADQARLVTEVSGIGRLDNVARLRHGGPAMSQVAVFASPAFQRGEEEWGGPDELDAVFSACCPQVQRGAAKLGRERRWPMFDRLPIGSWVRGRLALTGDAAHPMLQYLAQGACQAIEDAWTLAAHAPSESDGREQWHGALAAYEKLRTERTAAVQLTARAWGDLWHCDGLTRSIRNELLRDRDPGDYKHIDWLYGTPSGR